MRKGAYLDCEQSLIFVGIVGERFCFREERGRKPGKYFASPRSSRLRRLPLVACEIRIASSLSQRKITTARSLGLITNQEFPSMLKLIFLFTQLTKTEQAMAQCKSPFYKYGVRNLFPNYTIPLNIT